MAEQEKLPVRFEKFFLLQRLAPGRASEIYIAADLSESPSGEPPLCIVKRRVPLGSPPAPEDILPKLRHPGVAKTDRYGLAQGYLYAVVELCDAVDLLTIWNRCVESRVPIRKEVSLAVMVGVLDALAYVHQKGTTHLQLCPAKVLVTRAGEVKLAEFRLSRVAGGLKAHEFACHRVGYVPPECQSRVSEVVDNRGVDVFAAGVLLWELLAQRPVYVARGGDVPGEFGVAGPAEALTGRIPPLSEIGVDGISPPIDALLSKALARSPRDRFKDGREFRDAFAELAPTGDVARATIADFVRELFGDTPLLMARERAKLIASASEIVAPSPSPGALPGAPPSTEKRPADPRATLVGRPGSSAPTVAAPAPVRQPPRPKATVTTLDDPRIDSEVRGVRRALFLGIGVALAIAVAGWAWRGRLRPPPNQPADSEANRSSSPVRSTTVAPPRLDGPLPISAAPAPSGVPAVVADEPARQLRDGRARSSKVPVSNPARTRPPHGELDSGHAADLVEKAEAAFEHGEFRAAVAYGRAAMKSGGGEKACLVVGAASFRAGDLEGARAAFDAALKLNPDSAAAKRGLEALAREATLR